MSATAGQARLWAQKWRWYERNSLPWNRAAIHWELMRRGAFARWPLEGNVLEALREGRLEIGEGCCSSRACGSRRPATARVRIGAGTFLNRSVMVASQRAGRDRRSLHARQRLLRLRRQPSLRRPRAPITWQGFESKGPTRIGDNCWLGADVVVTSGVTIGERCVIGANSVVTRDIEPFSIAAGAPGEGAAAQSSYREQVASRAMELYEAMRCAPTSRRFTDEPVAPRRSCGRSTPRASPRAAATARAGAWSSSPTRSTRAALRDLYLPHWRAYMELTGGARMLERPGAPSTPRARGWCGAPTSTPRTSPRCRSTSSSACSLADLAVTDEALPRTSIVGGASVYPFVQNLLLALRAEGLGASMTTLLVPAEAEVARAARDPRGRRPGGAHRRRPPRRPLAEAARAPAGRRSSPSPSASASRSSPEHRHARGPRSSRAEPSRRASRRYSAGGTGTALKASCPSRPVRPRPVAVFA